jgi:hypothetical protein
VNDEPTGSGKRIGAAIAVLVGLAGSLWHWWDTPYRIVCFAIALAALLAFLLAERVATRWVTTIMALGVALSVSIYKEVPPPRPGETTHGWLVPANDPTPPNACSNTAPTQVGPPGFKMPPLPPHALLFIFGRSAAWATRENGTTRIAQAGSCTMSAVRNGRNLAIDADIYDINSDLVARIRKNEFRLIPGKYSYEEQPDESTLIVHDKQGKELLYVRYANIGAVRVRGVFACSDISPVVVTNDKIIASGTLFDANCGGDAGMGLGVGMMINPRRQP